VGEDDVLEALEAVRVQPGLHPVLSGELVAEDHVALQDPAAAPARRKRTLVLDRLAGIVKQNAGEGEIGVHLRIEREERAAGAGHPHGVFEETVPVSVMHRYSCRRPAEGGTDLLEDPAHRSPELLVPEHGDARLQLRPERLRVLGRQLD
jgi:hypothetical protein